MFSCFNKSVERTNEVLQNPFGVYDLTFLEWEQKKEIMRNNKIYICSQKSKKQKKDMIFELIFKKKRFSMYSIYRTNTLESAQKMLKSISNKLNSISVGIVSNKPLVVAPILKEVVKSILTHPKWSIAHIAAKTGLEQLFLKKDEKIMSDLNTQCEPDLSTPLHLSIDSNRVNTTKAILSLKPKLDLRDKFGNTAYHLAAMSHKDILRELLSVQKKNKTREMLKPINNRKCTPIHLCCYSLKYENLIILMEFGLTLQMLTITKPSKIIKKSEQNSKNSKNSSDRIINFKSEDIEDLDCNDMQFGGTPLHWVRHRRALERFIDMGFNLDEKNALGETPLHTMVKRLRLKCMIGLLCFGAKVDRKNQLKETALHLAVKVADVTSTQALIIFEAQINFVNKNRETVRHIAAQTEHPDHHLVLYLLSAIGAQRCSKEMSNCKNGCAYNGDYEGKAYYRWPKYDNETLYKKVLLEAVVKEALKNKYETNEKSKKVKMLCLDGGGIRGLITLQILIELDKQMKDTSISDIFQWIAGTSTGSILAFLISTGRHLSDIKRIYFRFKDKILVGPRPYNSTHFENLLKDEFGDKTTMAEVKTKHNRHLIINAVLIDRIPAKLHVFRSYESPEEVLGLPEVLPGFKKYPGHKEQIAWKACRASGAAPTYFRASGPFLDGGLIANNPTLDALTEFYLYNNSLKAVGRAEETTNLELVMSLGTGKFPTTPTEPIDIIKIKSLNPREIHRNTMYIKQMGNLLLNQVCATEGYVVDRAQSFCCATKTPYFRLNPNLSEVISLDETSDVEICNAMWETKAYMYAMKDEISNLIDLLSPESYKQRKTPDMSITIDLNKNEIQIITKNSEINETIYI